MNNKLIVVFSFLSSVFSLIAAVDLFSRVKRTDIDLSTCIDNFDIHKDKIIRTQDSQKMGAKYLNAIDLGSRQECLRLCCETENCDVFVYEDKNSGGCYLFHCGPPEDFKCKFTHHVNYSSAVLALNRHVPDLESQMKLTKHEQDLTKLRKVDNDPNPEPHIQEDKSLTSISSSTTMKSKESTSEQKAVVNEKRCSRYQFECRSTGECIAIYNACDGIPQCADGSDEATELGCPDLSTPTPPPPQRTMVVNNPPPVTTFNKNSAPAKQPESPPPMDMYHPPPARAEIIPDEQLSPASNPDFLRPQEPRAPQRPAQYPDSPDYIPQMAWNAHQTNQLPYQIPPVYPGKPSHIFTHKENGLQVPEAEISSYADNVNYPKVPNYYGENYRQQIDGPNWINNHQEDLRYPARYNADPGYGSNNNNRPITTQQVSEKYVPQEKTSTWSGEKENPEHIQIKMAHELKNPTKEVHTQEPHNDIKIKIVERPAEVKRDEYPDVVAYKMDGNDGVAQTPGGAVLSLTLGLMITCIMAVMVACRMRIVRRRTRKSGKGYAHDADYLVNGMYL